LKKKNDDGGYKMIITTVVLIISYFLMMPNPQLEEDFVETMVKDYMKHTPAGSKLLQEQIPKSSKKKLLPSEMKWSSYPLTGATIAISGSTSGIGKAIAKNAHGLGATVIAIGRSPTKLANLQFELEGDRKNTKKSRIVPIIADYSDLESVTKAADEIKRKAKVIDILVNNAGIHYNFAIINPFSEILQTKQGHDLTFGVNYLSHFLLTSKLIPLLEKSNLQPRIIQISSSYHWMTEGSELQVQPNEKSPLASQSHSQTFTHKNRSYANSKLAQIYHMRALARRLETTKSPIKIVSVCPAWVSTEIVKNYGLQSILDIWGFPADGVGISSALNAMFLPFLGGEGADFVSQVSIPNDFPQRPELIVKFFEWLGIRDMMANIGAFLMLPVQRYIFQSQVVRKSSAESYHVEKQESLYEWSEKEVSPFL